MLDRIGRANKRLRDWLDSQLSRFGVTNDAPLVELCKHFESFKASWYSCSSNVRTIGYGYTGSASGLPAAPWTEPYAAKVLLDELRGRYRRWAVEALAKCGVDMEALPPRQQYAIVSLCHNAGPGAIWLREGRPATWVIRWQAGDPRNVVEGSFYQWNRSGGKVSPGLVRRRFAEMRLFWDGVLDFDPIGWRTYYETRRDS